MSNLTEGVKVSERFIEDYFYDNINLIVPENNVVRRFVYRQVKIGSYGVADLVVVDLIDYKTVSGREKGWDISVVELKANPITPKDVSQCLRYTKGVEEVIENTRRLKDNSFFGRKDYYFNSPIGTPEVSGITVGFGDWVADDSCFIFEEFWGSEKIILKTAKFTFDKGISVEDFPYGWKKGNGDADLTNVRFQTAKGFRYNV